MPRFVLVPSLVSCLFVLLPCPKYPLAQTLPSSDVLRYIGVKDGIANQFILSIYTDPSGLLWFGTHVGLYQFDGFRIQRFGSLAPDVNNLQNRPISCLEAGPDSSRELFVCTTEGTFLINIASQQGISSAQYGISDTLMKGWIQIKKAGQGIYYALGKNTLYRLTPTAPNRFQVQALLTVPRYKFAELIIGPENTGDIWILPKGKNEVYRVHDGHTHTYQLPKPLINAPAIKGLVRLIYTGRIVIGWDLMRNTYRFNEQKNQFEQLPPGFNLEEIIPGLAAADQYLHKKTVPICQYSMETGQIAIGTSTGLILLSHRPVLFHSVESLRGEEIRGILTNSSGQWWAGTYNGLFSGHLKSSIVQNDSLLKGVWGFLPAGPGSWMLAVEAPKAIWLWDQTTGSTSSLFTVMNGNRYTTTGVLSLCRDFKGIVWAGGADQLFCNSTTFPRRFTGFRDPASGNLFAPGFIRVLLSDRDSSIWVGSEEGLHRLIFNRTLDRFEVDPKSPYIRGVPIDGFYQDTFRNLWVATRGRGVARLAGAGAPIEWMDETSGLSCNSTCRIEGSNNDRILWISTFNGLSRFDRKTGVIHNFYEESGFPGNEFNTAASARFPDGTLMFGGVNGMILFHPDSIPVANFKYKTIVLAAKVFARQKGELSAGLIDRAKGIHLQPNTEYLEFLLGSNKFVESNDVRFRYRLNGLLADWTYTSGENSAKFIHPLPGTYHFEAQAIMPDGHLGEIVSIPVFIAPPFYATWWFRALLILTIIGSAYAAYRLRVQQLIREQLIRQQIADDLHDDIGNKLSIINILAQEIAEGIEHRGHTPPELTLKKMLEVTRETLRSLHTSIWSVDPSKDRLDNLIARIQDFADDCLSPLNIRYHFDLKGPFPDREINLKTRHHVILIYQELLTNMVKHTNPVQITFFLEIENKQTLRLEIANTHRQAPHVYQIVESAHRGLASTERRLEQIQGKITWSDLSDTEQKITLAIPNLFKNY